MKKYRVFKPMTPSDHPCVHNKISTQSVQLCATYIYIRMSCFIILISYKNSNSRLNRSYSANTQPIWKKIATNLMWTFSSIASLLMRSLTLLLMQFRRKKLRIPPSPPLSLSIPFYIDIRWMTGFKLLSL